MARSIKASAGHQEPRSNGARSQVWRLPSTGGVSVQFVAPEGISTFESLTDLGTLYREVYCPKFAHVSGEWSTGPWEGQPRADIPKGMRDIPIDDWEPVEQDGQMVAKIEHYSDTIAFEDGTELNVLKDVLDGESVREQFKGWLKDDAGFLKPSWRVLVDVVVHSWPKANDDDAAPEPGDHILLKLYDGDWLRSIAPRLDDAANLGADVFSRVWDIEIIPKGKSPRMVTCGARREIVPVLDVEPIIAGDVLDTTKDNFTKVAIAAYLDQASPEGEQADAPDFVPTTIAYSRMSPARLRTVLADAGVDYDAKATHKDLVALAEANL